jgi:hypothetical protein
VIGEVGVAVAKAEPSLTDSEGFEHVAAAVGLVSFLYLAQIPRRLPSILYARACARRPTAPAADHEAHACSDSSRAAHPPILALSVLDKDSFLSWRL